MMTFDLLGALANAKHPLHLDLQNSWSSAILLSNDLGRFIHTTQISLTEVGLCGIFAYHWRYLSGAERQVNM